MAKSVKKKVTKASERRVAKRADPAGKEAFWPRQKRFYFDGWRAVWRWSTLKALGLDAALLVAALFFFLLFGTILGLVAEPVMPLYDQVRSLDAMNPADPGLLQQRAELVDELEPGLTRALLVGAIVGLLLLGLFTALYALAKTRIWAWLRDQPFSWRRWRANLWLTLSWAAVLLFAPLLFLRLPLVAALLYTLLLFATLSFLPLFYATGEWRSLRWRPFGHYLFLLLLLGLSWFPVPLLARLVGFASPGLQLLILFCWLLLYLSWARHCIARFAAWAEVSHG